MEVVATGSTAELSRWKAPPGVTLGNLVFRDADGTLAMRKAGAGPTYEASRPARGPLRVAYDVPQSPASLRSLPAMEVTPDKFRATGERILVLPASFDDREVPTSIRFVVDDIGSRETVGAASSFGVGASRSVVATGRELRFGVYLAGAMGSAVFRAPEGVDDAAWFGYTAFDPRTIAADVAAFRTAVGQAFGVPEPLPLAFLLVSDGRKPNDFAAHRRARSVVVQVAPGQAWTGALRIAVAAEVLHGWIGSRLWVGPREPGREAEAYWFTEGLNRYLARAMLFRFGLLTPAEVLDEMHGLAREVAASPLRGESNEALAKHVGEPGVLPLLVARGALMAAREDFLLAAKSHRKVPLESWLNTLFRSSAASGGALPASVWTDLLTSELGEDETQLFDAVMAGRLPVAMPRGVLGPCFAEQPRGYEPFELGFRLQAQTADAPGTGVAGDVRQDGPAYRAGLRDGDVVRGLTYVDGRADIAAQVVVERGGERKTLEFRPVGRRVKGFGWRRDERVATEDCVP